MGAVPIRRNQSSPVERGCRRKFSVWINIGFSTVRIHDDHLFLPVFGDFLPFPEHFSIRSFPCQAAEKILHTAYPFLPHSGQSKNPAGAYHLPGSEIPILFSRFSYYFLIKILILIRKASPEGAACFVIYKERNHKTSLI